MVLNFHYLQTVHHNSYADDPYAREFGIKISDRLAAVEARILPAPQVTATEYFVFISLFSILGFFQWSTLPCPHFIKLLYAAQVS